MPWACDGEVSGDVALGTALGERGADEDGRKFRPLALGWFQRSSEVRMVLGC